MFFRNHAHYVYIVSCSDGKLYTGMTWNLRRRIRQHNGTDWGGGKYTSHRRPVFLVHVERFEKKREAHMRELDIKALSHFQKQELIRNTTKDAILSAI